MNLKARVGALLGLISCSSVLVFERVWQLRSGTIHTMIVVIFSAGVALTLAGLISPETTQPTAQGKLSPLANKISLIGLAIGAAMVYWIREW